MRDDDFDEPDRGSDDEYPFPQAVYFAGITWIVFGCLILINAVAQLALTANQGGQQNGAQAAGGVCGVVIAVLFGAAFLFVGIQSCKGTAKDTLGNAIGSIVFSLLVGGVGVVAIIGGIALQAMVGQAQNLALLAVIMGAVNVLCALGLLAAGVMALIGRQAYKDWRWANRLDEPPRRRRN